MSISIRDRGIILAAVAVVLFSVMFGPLRSEALALADWFDALAEALT